MRIIFPSEPFAPSRVDAAYEREAEAASAVGCSSDLINYEALVRGESASAVRRIKADAEIETAVYRGWILKPDVYAKLYEALQTKNLRLINSPESYRHCHYLPESYDIIKTYTPPTIAIKLDEDFSFDLVMKRLEVFGGKPLIVKDYVKSRKHEWAEACFIPAASSRQDVERVVKRFIELQGDDLAEGLVFREFVEYQPLGNHTQSKMPLTREFRLFFLNGKLMTRFAYWDEGDYGSDAVPHDLFNDVARQVESRFFTMDVAQTVSGEWMIVELGDGQVAGLPSRADVIKFYRELI